MEFYQKHIERPQSRGKPDKIKGGDHIDEFEKRIANLINNSLARFRLNETERFHQNSRDLSFQDTKFKLSICHRAIFR